MKLLIGAIAAAALLSVVGCPCKRQRASAAWSLTARLRADVRVARTAGSEISMSAWTAGIAARLSGLGTSIRRTKVKSEQRAWIAERNACGAKFSAFAAPTFSAFATSKTTSSTFSWYYRAEPFRWQRRFPMATAQRALAVRQVLLPETRWRCRFCRRGRFGRRRARGFGRGGPWAAVVATRDGGSSGTSIGFLRHCLALPMRSPLQTGPSW